MRTDDHVHQPGTCKTTSLLKVCHQAIYRTNVTGSSHFAWHRHNPVHVTEAGAVNMPRELECSGQVLPLMGSCLQICLSLGLNYVCTTTFQAAEMHTTNKLEGAWPETPDNG